MGWIFSISRNIRKVFIWENIRNFLILELESCFSWNIKNIFRAGFFLFFQAWAEKYTMLPYNILLSFNLFGDSLPNIYNGVFAKKLHLPVLLIISAKKATSSSRASAVEFFCENKQHVDAWLGSKYISVAVLKIFDQLELESLPLFYCQFFSKFTNLQLVYLSCFGFRSLLIVNIEYNFVKKKGRHKSNIATTNFFPACFDLTLIWFSLIFRTTVLKSWWEIFYSEVVLKI